MEGRRMVDIAEKQKRVIQVGTWQRSQQPFLDAIAYVRSGKLGKINVCRAWKIQAPSAAVQGHESPKAPPAELDYDLWVGPAEMVPYQENRCHYRFRWYYNFAAGMTGDWGVHMIDPVIQGMSKTDVRLGDADEDHEPRRKVLRRAGRRPHDARHADRATGVPGVRDAVGGSRRGSGRGLGGRQGSRRALHRQRRPGAGGSRRLVDLRCQGQAGREARAHRPRRTDERPARARRGLRDGDQVARKHPAPTCRRCTRPRRSVTWRTSRIRRRA